MLTFIDLPYPQIKAKDQEQLEAQINDYMYKVIEALQFALADMTDTTDGLKTSVQAVASSQTSSAATLQTAKAYASQVSAAAEARAKRYTDEEIAGQTLTITPDYDTGYVTFTLN